MPNDWTHMVQTWWSDNHYEWARAIAATSVERLEVHVQEGKPLHAWDPPTLGKFWASYTKLRKLIHLYEAFMQPCELLSFGSDRTCSARARNLHLFWFFRGYRSNHLACRVQIWWAACHHRRAGANCHWHHSWDESSWEARLNSSCH